VGASHYRVAFYGLGEIGRRALRMALKSSRITVVGAIDTDEEKIGKDAGTLAGSNQHTGVAVSADVHGVLADSRPDVVIHTTDSLIERVSSQVVDIISSGAHCISSAEELFYPRPDTLDFFTSLHDCAVQHGVSILGTGVNPGYVMDGLPLFLTKSCETVQSITVERIVDASTRRFPLQKKVGLGLHPDAFIDLVKEKKMGHRGLLESMYSLAKGLGWNLDKIEEEVEPVIAREQVRTAFFSIDEGQTMGMKHRGWGFLDGERVITLDLQMYVGPPKVYDRIVISGVPSLDVTVAGGIPGDDATASILIHSIPSIMECKPGFVNLQGMPFIHTIFSQISDGT
jgi:hypothetical protein